MYDRFRWTNVSARRNGLTMEYEPFQPFFLLTLAEKAGCGTFIDVGANVGIYSLFSTLLPNIGRVVAFEANPETVRELRSNISLNNLGHKIEVQAKALSSEPGKLTFGVVSKFSGANSVMETSIHDASTFHKQLLVDAVTLDEVFPTPFAHPFAIKIDVEGHENEVIEGGRGFFKRNRGIVQLECYDRSDTSTAKKLEQLGFFRLTAIGPDNYYSNIEIFRRPELVIEVYEYALSQMIATNHRNKAVVIKRGDYALQLTGRSADFARRMAKRLIGKRL